MRGLVCLHDFRYLLRRKVLAERSGYAPGLYGDGQSFLTKARLNHRRVGRHLVCQHALVKVRAVLAKFA